VVFTDNALKLESNLICQLEITTKPRHLCTRKSQKIKAVLLYLKINVGSNEKCGRYKQYEPCKI
jgi:hypothetical protein